MTADPRPSPVSAADVAAAARRLAGVVRQTPLHESERLSAATGARVLVKREDLQPVRSYKLRGAYNLMAGLSAGERRAGVVCASAGNHAQGVAFACRELGVHARVFIPGTTPRQKREQIASIGGDWVEIVVGGETYDAAAELAVATAEHSGAVLVPAFDDPRVMAGQGTVAAEIIDQLGEAPDVLVVPVGGGGMIAGCAAWCAEHAPDTRIVGVEPGGAAGMAAALAAGAPVELEVMDGFIDGAAVARVGAAPYAVVRRRNVEMVAIPEGRVCSEMLALYQVDGIIAEPAGALATSALGAPDTNPAIHVESGKTVVAIISGGNNDVSRYGEIVERSLVHEGRKHYFLVNFPQEPGALRRFLDGVLGPNDDITLFEYVKRNNRETGPALVGVELRHRDDLPGLLARMETSPLRVDRVDPESLLYRFLL